MAQQVGVKNRYVVLVSTSRDAPAFRLNLVSTKITTSWSREADVSVSSRLFAYRAQDIILRKFCKHN